MDGLKTVIPDAVMVHDLDGGGNPDRALEVSSAALAKNAGHQHHLRHQRFVLAGRPAGLEGGRQVAGRTC